MDLAEPPAKKTRIRNRGNRRAHPGAVAAPAVADPPAVGKSKGVCFAFNIGRCSGACPNGFPHKCCICDQVHPAFATKGCRDKVDLTTGRPKAKGKGGGK